MSENVQIDAAQLVEAFARLKRVPIAKVIRNAARDFVREAYRRTPLAKVNRSEYYLGVDSKDPSHKWYIHETMRRGRSGLRKVRVRKGYSRATWAGAFATLGLPSVKEGAKYPVAAKSGVVQRETTSGAEAAITDQVRFDAWGRTTSDAKHEEIVRAGYANAAAHMAAEYNRLVQEAWRG